VDTVERRAYFRSVHEWDVATGSRWRKRSKAASMPLTTRVSDTETLLAAIRSAYARLEELYPGTIAAAARQEAERLSRIDPRFKYAFSVDESGGELMALHAREKVKAKFELHGPPAIRKWEEMLRTGKPVEFVPGEIRFEEAGIFGELQRKAAGRGLFSPASAATSSEEPMSGVSKRGTPSYPFRSRAASGSSRKARGCA
jgi:hypothetical protein